MELFRSALEKCNLSDLGYSRAKFTWTNCQPDGNFIKVRLDWVVANTQWCSMFKEASVQVLAGRSSDHKPIQLTLATNLQVHGKKRRGFKFELNWTLEAEYQQVVEEAWNVVPNDDAISKLCKCRISLQKWIRSEIMLPK